MRSASILRGRRDPDGAVSQKAQLVVLRVAASNIGPFVTTAREVNQLPCLKAGASLFRDRSPCPLRAPLVSLVLRHSA